MDIFCQVNERLKNQIIDKSPNFFILHDGYPLTEGHLLIIPKKHYDCYLNLDKKLLNEFLMIKNKALSFLTDNYQYPVVFEHGMIGQTIFHAHLHLLPTNKIITNELKKFGEIVKKPTIPYLYFEYKDKNCYFKPTTLIKPGLIHSIIYANLLKRPREGSKRAKNLNSWLLKVKAKFRLWKD